MSDTLQPREYAPPARNGHALPIDWQGVPDDAIHRGYDSVAERDIATPGTLLSNFAPLPHAGAVAMRDDAVSSTALT